jgi:Rieske Fe-S protein
MVNFPKNYVFYALLKGTTYMKQEESAKPEARVNRRSLLCGIAFMGLGLAADLIPTSADAATGVTFLKNGKLQITRAANKALEKVGGTVVVPLQDGSNVAIVRATSATTGFVALSLACPHQGVNVQAQGKEWVCPAHGSAFTLAGALTQGPARQGLHKFPLAVSTKYLTVG